LTRQVFGNILARVEPQIPPQRSLTHDVDYRDRQKFL
jgi:hypothetical protein